MVWLHCCNDLIRRWNMFVVFDLLGNLTCPFEKNKKNFRPKWWFSRILQFTLDLHMNNTFTRRTISFIFVEFSECFIKQNSYKTRLYQINWSDRRKIKKVYSRVFTQLNPILNWIILLRCQPLIHPFLLFSFYNTHRPTAHVSILMFSTLSF